VPIIDDVPDRLWHYTTTPSLLSIINSERIWATDAMYLNDSRELLEGAGRLDFEATRALAEPTPNPSPVRALWLEIERALGSHAKVLMPEQGPFVACFCSEGDLLSQWRGYSSGSGYAIGFSGASLRALAESIGGSLMEVIYDPPDAGQASLFYGSAMTVGESGNRLIPGPLALAKFKHPAFREEREWRLVVPASTVPLAEPKPSVKFRSGTLGVAPYLEIGFGRDAIAEVRVGPGGDQELRRLAVQRMLDNVDIPAVTSTSEAPFRG
jgi:Protein of unknown function (DUF2971)